MLTLIYKVDGIVKTSFEKENEDYSLDTFEKENETIIKIKPKKEIQLLEAYLDISHLYSKNECLYLNGYQSWTDTREFDINEDLNSLDRFKTCKYLKKFSPFHKKVMDMFHFKEYGDEVFKKYKLRVLHGYTFSYIRNKETGNAILYGSKNCFNAFLIINHDIKHNRIRLESDVNGRVINKEFTLFDFIKYEGNYLNITREYLSLYKTNRDIKPLRGYTSWYNHYQNINEEVILKNLDSIDSKEYDLFQIDDGYETFVGDWLNIDKEKFPNGLKPILEKIHQKGLKAGIWLAPLVAEKDSRLFKEHPEFIYRENGKEVYAGCNWSGDCPLDVNKPEVIEYIKKCLRYYKELGFDFFKLDFLYAACLVKSESKTRAEQMRFMMELIRNELGEDSLILGCGVPLSSCFNLIDYMRIGPDVSLKFDDKFYMKLFHRERISTKITLVNTIYRNYFDKVCFLNDPDVYLLRDKNIELNEKQKESLVIINHLCGSLLMTSDDVSEYDVKQKKILEEARKYVGSKIIDIRKNKSIIDIDFVNNGGKYTLRYISKKGEIAWIRPL